MKVLHLSSEKSWRGGEQQIAYLIEELAELGVENIACVKKSSEFEAYCELNNIRHYSLPFVNSADVGSAMHLAKVFKRANPDIIHIHSSKSHGVAALSSFFGMRAPIVISRRVDFPLKSNFYSKWKYNHHQIKKIICVSKSVEDIVAQNLEYPEKLTTIYSGIKLSRFENAIDESILKSKYQLSKDSILIGNTSALADHKDYFTFLRVAKNVISSKENTYFFLIGEGKLKTEIQSKIDSYGLQKRIFITGGLNNIPSILKELDVFLMTSKTEGLGTSVLDAFASKLPVVSTNAGGLKELVKNLETGLIADVGDDVELAKHVMTFAHNGELRNKIVTNAYEFVKSFSSKKTATQTLDVYKSILGE